MAMSPDKGYAAMAVMTAASAAILASVYVARYGFDLWPCSLCYV